MGQLHPAPIDFLKGQEAETSTVPVPMGGKWIHGPAIKYGGTLRTKATEGLHSRKCLEQYSLG